MVVFIVHLAYARVSTKWRHMCGAHKIFYVAGVMCARHARTCMYTPMPTLPYFLS